MIYAFLAGILFGQLPRLDDVDHLPGAFIVVFVSAVALAYGRRGR